MAYEMTDSKARLTQRYVELSLDLERVVREGGLSGAIYTQTTDVENEVNGYLTYDRQDDQAGPGDGGGAKPRGDRRGRRRGATARHTSITALALGSDNALVWPAVIRDAPVAARQFGKFI